MVTNEPSTSSDASAIRTWGGILGVGWVLGAAIALIGRVDDELYVTDGWAYRPRDQWWLHGILTGLGFVAVFVALLIGFRILGWLFSTPYPFAIVGAFLVAMAIVMVVVGFQSESRGDRIGFAVIAALPGLMGALMIWANFGTPRGERRTRG